MSNKPTYEELEQRVKELEQAEFQCKQAEDKLNSFIHSVPDSVLLFDLELNCLDINTAALTYFPTGTSREDVVGKQMLEISPNLDKTSRYDKYREVVRTGIPFSAEDVIPHQKFGNKNLRVQAFKVSNGLGMITIDTTERKKTEEALKESEEKYRSMTESMKDLVYICSVDFKITYLNHAMIEKIGHDAVGEFCYSALHNLKEKCPWCVHEQVQKGEHFETEFLSPKDNRSYSSSNAPMFHQDGTISKMTICRDVTERKQNEEKLNEYSNHLEDLVKERTVELEKEISERKQVEETLRNEKMLTEEYINSLPGLFYVFDKQSFIQWNKQWEKVTGFSASEISQMYGPDFFKGSDKTLIEERMSEVFVTGKSEAEADLVTKQGIRIPYYFSGLRKEINGKPHLVGLGIDITDRKQADEALRESEERFRLVTKAAEVGITETDLISGAVEWDETCYKIHGYKPETKIELDYYLDKILHPEEKTRVLPKYRSVLESNDNRYRVEYRIIRPDGSVRWLDEDHVIIRDEDDNAIRTYSAKIDITERKKAEEQIKASLKEKETLLYEIHHRVKNSMTVISSLLKLQANRMDDERFKAALMDSQNRVQSMSAIHETLYQSDNLSAVNMNTYLTNLVRAVAQNYSIGNEISLIVEAANILIGVKQASPIGLIVNELITNSYKYAFPDNPEGEIKIKLQKTENQIELEYADNGIGIPKDLDWKNSNTLGLKLVLTLVENQLDGSIDLDNTNGTKFIIKFNIET